MMTSNGVIIWAYSKGYRVDGKGQLISPNGILRRPHRTRYGYADTTVRIDGYLYHLPIHRLAVYQKYGELALEAQCVRHLDGNPYNNSLDNLEIGTLSDNSLDIPKEKRIEIAKNANKAKSSYRTDDEVLEIKKYHNEVKSYKLTKARFGISSNGTLFYILNCR